MSMSYIWSSDLAVFERLNKINMSDPLLYEADQDSGATRLHLQWDRKFCQVRREPEKHGTKREESARPRGPRELVCSFLFR